MPGHSRSQNGVAEPVIGPATSGRTRWLAYAGHPDPSGTALMSEMAGTSPAMTDGQNSDCTSPQMLMAWPEIVRPRGDARNTIISASCCGAIISLSEACDNASS
jgi:hypothetical protein